MNRLAKASRFKTVRTEIVVVQPGMRQSAVADDQAMVLNAAHAFLMETVNIPLAMICSDYSAVAHGLVGSSIDAGAMS